MRVLTLARHYSVAGAAVVAQRQQVVYLPCAGDAPAKPAAAADASVPPTMQDREVQIDVIDVFRFCAVTYNSHRIHYDRPYASAREGWSRLLVQAKFIALLLLQEYQARGGRPVKKLSLRAIEPLLCPASLTLRITPGAEPGVTDLLAWNGAARHVAGTVQAA